MREEEEDVAEPGITVLTAEELEPGMTIVYVLNGCTHLLQVIASLRVTKSDGKGRITTITLFSIRIPRPGWGRREGDQGPVIEKSDRPSDDIVFVLYPDRARAFLPVR